MEFMQKYKHLDKLCKEMNVVGITGYIDAMSKISNGYLLVDGQKDDYYKLKHYRYIRNQISHDEYSYEETLCDENDQNWLDDFY